MYSLVLMSAFVSGPDVPQFNGYFRDLFSFRGSCSGCYGSCDGRTAGGYATSCHGCGGGEDRSFGWRVRSLFSFGCGGGSCHGSCQGCYGGCSGQRSASGSCHGGGCYGSTARIGTGCYGLGCSGAIYDGGMMPGGAYPIYPGTTNPSFPGGPMIPDAGDPPARQRPAPPDVDESRSGKSPVLPAPGNLNADPNRATVTVRAPADAKVFAEGTPLRLTDGERTFVTPALPTGQKFDYTFRVEYIRDGETLSRERKVSVRAGGLSVCDFTESSSGKLPSPPSPIPNEVKETVGKMIPSAEPMSAKIPRLFPISTPNVKSERPTMLPPATTNGPERAKFTVKLPDNAVLYVDGRKNEKPGTVREFVTPPLPQGQEFKYELKVEVPGPHGYPQSATTTVSFRAGDTVPTLDFVDLLKK